MAIIKGWKADESGNLMFRKTARNFNQPAATCGKVCVAEVEEIVPVGSLDPDCIHLPSIYVKRLILGAPYDKKIEFRTVRRKGGGLMATSRIKGWTRDQMAARAAKELQDGYLRQPRHRHPDAGRQQYPGRA